MPPISHPANLRPVELTAKEMKSLCEAGGERYQAYACRVSATENLCVIGGYESFNRDGTMGFHASVSVCHAVTDKWVRKPSKEELTSVIHFLGKNFEGIDNYGQVAHLWETLPERCP